MWGNLQPAPFDCCQCKERGLVCSCCLQRETCRPRWPQRGWQGFRVPGCAQRELLYADRSRQECYHPVGHWFEKQIHLPREVTVRSTDSLQGHNQEWVLARNPFEIVRGFPASARDTASCVLEEEGLSTRVLTPSLPQWSRV